jgi:hypothetical protein
VQIPWLSLCADAWKKVGRILHVTTTRGGQGIADMDMPSMEQSVSRGPPQH